MSGYGDNVVELPGDPPPPEPERVTPPSRLHGLSIAGMAGCALVGIVAMLAFITVNWSHRAGRVVVAGFVLSGIGFLACASMAVLTAARDTYPRDGRARPTAGTPSGSADEG